MERAAHCEVTEDTNDSRTGVSLSARISISRLSSKSASRSVELNVGFAVQHLAFGEDLFQVGHRVPIVGHRAHVALSNHALHVLFGRSANPNREATR